MADARRSDFSGHEKPRMGHRVQCHLRCYPSESLSHGALSGDLVGGPFRISVYGTRPSSSLRPGRSARQGTFSLGPTVSALSALSGREKARWSPSRSFGQLPAFASDHRWMEVLYLWYPTCFLMHVLYPEKCVGERGYYRPVSRPGSVESSLYPRPS